MESDILRRRILVEERPDRLGTTLVEYRRISVIGKADLGFGSVSISSIRYESLRFIVSLIASYLDLAMQVCCS